MCARNWEDAAGSSRSPRSSRTFSCLHTLPPQGLPSALALQGLGNPLTPQSGSPPARGCRRSGRTQEHRCCGPPSAARLGARTHALTEAALPPGHELGSARLSPEISEVSDRGDALLTAGTEKCSLVLSPKQPGVAAGCSSFSHRDRSLLNLQHQPKAKSVLALLHLPLDTTAHLLKSALCLKPKYSGQPLI